MGFVGSSVHEVVILKICESLKLTSRAKTDGLPVRTQLLTFVCKSVLSVIPVVRSASWVSC